jgi:hypothetical protein
MDNSARSSRRLQRSALFLFFVAVAISLASAYYVPQSFWIPSCLVAIYAAIVWAGQYYTRVTAATRDSVYYLGFLLTQETLATSFYRFAQQVDDPGFKMQVVPISLVVSLSTTAPVARCGQASACGYG